MARKRSYRDIRRMLLRRLVNEPDDKLVELRDYLWDTLIARRFLRGYGTAHLALEQPSRNRDQDVESAIRRVMRRQK